MTLAALAKPKSLSSERKKGLLEQLSAKDTLAAGAALGTGAGTLSYGQTSVTNALLKDFSKKLPGYASEMAAKAPYGLRGVTEKKLLAALKSMPELVISRPSALKAALGSGAAFGGGSALALLAAAALAKRAPGY